MKRQLRSYYRTWELNFCLVGVLGFDMNGETVGVVGKGKIGALLVRIAAGFGCKVLAYDVRESPEALLNMLVKRDLKHGHHPVSLSAFPLTKHLIIAESVAKMKDGAMLTNSRGGFIDTKAFVYGLKRGKIGSVGLGVFEGEGEYFYWDRSGGIMADEAVVKWLMN